MIKQKRNLNIASAICILIIIIMAITGLSTACSPPIDETNISSGSEGPVVVKVETNNILNPNDNEVEEINKPKKKSIIIDPVETEERAIEIAKKFNILCTENFRYEEFADYNVPAFHIVIAEDDRFATYMIYDINGEIMYLESDANLNDKDATIDEEQAKVRAKEIIECYYGDVDITIDTCELINGKFFRACGEIYKDIEGSIRPFELQMNGDGQIFSVRAEYDGIYAMDLLQETIDKVLAYSKTGSKDIELIQQNERYGELQYLFMLDDRHTVVEVRASDNFLLHFGTSFGDEAEKEDYDISENESRKLGKEFLLEYYPMATDIEYTGFEIHEEQGYLSGKLKVDGQAYDFDVAILFDKTLGGIGVIKVQDFESMEKVTVEIAEQKAREMILDECPFAKDKLELVKSYENDDENRKELCMFEFEYTSNNPTIRDYSFIGTAGVNMYTDKFGIMRVEPILEGLDILSKEEFIEKAKQYIHDEYDVDKDKLKFKRIEVLTGIILEYQVDFEFDEKTSYGASMLADTGELDGVGMSTR